MDSLSLPNFSVFVKPIVDDQEDEMNFQDEVDDQVVLDDQLDKDFDGNLDRDEEDDDYNEDEEEDADDPNNKEYTNGKGTLDDDNQTSEETDNKKDSKENPIAPNSDGDHVSSDAKEPATEQIDGPLDALKDAKQQWEDDQKTASDTFMETTQQMASDEYKDTKQQAEETDQKMASDTFVETTQQMASNEYKDTKQQAEETDQKMASDTFMETTKQMASDEYKDTTQQTEETDQKVASDTFMETTQQMASDEYKDTKQQAEETDQKMASDENKDTKQQAEETQKMASDTYKDTKQQAEETQKMASDKYKDTKQQMEETQKMASDAYKDTTRQMEKTQKMASDAFKDANKVMGTSNKPFVTSNNNNNAAAAIRKPQQKPQGRGQQQSQGKPQQKPQGLGQRESPEEQQPMESGPTPQPQQTPQTLQKSRQQQLQPPPQQKRSASPTPTEQQPQENKVSDTPPNTQLLPQQQQLEAHAKPIPSVQEIVPIPSGVVAPKTQIQKVRVSSPQAQAKQLPQQDSISPPKAEAQPQVNHETVASQKMQPQPQPQPEKQTQPRSIPLVPEKIGSPSGGVVPPTPTPEEDATNLYRAFKGIGCDVGQLVQVLSRHRQDPKHRHLIQQHYKKNYGEDLRDRISSELSTFGKGFLKEKVGLDLSMKATGSLGWLCKDSKRAISLWLLEESERDATIVWQSLQLMSLDKAALTEVICSRTPSQIRSLKRAYFTYFKSELSKDIGSSTLLINSNTKELLAACLDDKARDEGTDVDLKMAEEDAMQLFKDGEKKKWGTNNKTFIDIFTKRNRPHFAAVDAAYDKLYGHSLEEAVRKETSRSFQAGLLTLLKCAKNPAKYFAEVLYNSMKGLGTSDTTLIRVVVTRAGIDMEDIKKEYVQAYKTSLKDYIHDDTSGDYRTFLLNLVE